MAWVACAWRTVVDQVLAMAWVACAWRTVVLVLAHPHPIVQDLLLETAVTIAVVIVFMHTRGLLVVHTFAVRPALVPLAVVLVDAALVFALRAVKLAYRLKLRITGHATIQRKTRIALEFGFVHVHEFFWRALHQPAVFRYVC